MRTAVLLWAAVMTVEARNIPFEGGNVLRADFFAKYRVDGRRVELTRGVVTFQLTNSNAPAVEIATPSITVQPFLPGEYRVEVNRFGETSVTPAGGEVRVVAPQGAQWVTPGQKMVARGPAGMPEYKIVDAAGRWRRLANRIALALNSISFGGGGGGGSEEAAVDSGGRREESKPAASQPEGRARNEDHPNVGPVASPHPSRGK